MFEGVYPPIPTPFVDGEVAHDKLSDPIEELAYFEEDRTVGLRVFGGRG